MIFVVFDLGFSTKIFIFHGHFQLNFKIQIQDYTRKYLREQEPSRVGFQKIRLIDWNNILYFLPPIRILYGLSRASYFRTFLAEITVKL